MAIAVVAVIGVVIILGSLLGRGDSPGYSVVIAFVILVSSVPIGMPVVTTTVPGCGRSGDGQAEGHCEQARPLPRCLS